MKVTITVDEKEIGNPSRGYHNHDTTITFTYDDESSYVEWKERDIVEAITGSGIKWMWYKVWSIAVHTWKANYGYDSG